MPTVLTQTGSVKLVNISNFYFVWSLHLKLVHRELFKFLRLGLSVHRLWVKGKTPAGHVLYTSAAGKTGCVQGETLEHG